MMEAEMQHNGFTLLQETEIQELNAKARLFEHDSSGARLLSFENDDENKVFGITFRTPPPDSTGLPHIMEHSVLGGSQKYPVKEPFVELMKGSLNTFLNAMTFPDKTCYPVASQNIQDFWNLVDVYMDAVLNPLIPPETLMQEGWHYELEDLEGPLDYKGIVFNEMKGAYSSPDALLGKRIQESLFPEHVYGVDSGGDPLVIPDLTYQQFKEYHQTYYHPMNAYIYFYGDDDPGERLRRMDGYLQGYQRIRLDSRIGLQSPFDAPRKMTFGFDPGEESDSGKKAMLAVNWMLAESTDPEVNLAMNILSYILVGTPASPLRKALIDSGLGDDLVGGGLDPDLRQMVFSTGLKGIAEDDSEKVEKIIFETLQQLANEGIDHDMVAAAMNTVEFRLRENNTGAFPRGLSLMLRALTTWLHDGNPVQSLAFEAPLNAIKNGLQKRGRYFEDLIQRLFLTNHHRTTVLLRPEPGLNQKIDQEEKKHLSEIKSRMDEETLRAVQENARALKLRQEATDSPEALETIPSLKLSDIDKKVNTIPVEAIDVDGKTILYHDLFTNGIIYLDLGFDLHRLPQELLPLTTLFGRVLTEMGTEKEDFVKLSQRIGKTTGGIRASSFISAVRDRPEAASWLFLRAKSTMTQRDDMLSVLGDLLLTANLDNRERFRQIVLEEKAGMESGLVPAGHRVVNTRLRSKFDEAGWVSEQVGGVSYLFFLRQLVNEIEADWNIVLEKLEKIRQYLIGQREIICNVTLDNERWNTFYPELYAFLIKLPNKKVPGAVWTPAMLVPYEGLTIPAQVNYVGKGSNLYRLGYSLHGSVNVIINYLRTTYLWERVRVQGGAYGGFCVFDPRSGVFTYLSYRDPNLLKTIENYAGAAAFLQELDLDRLSEDELTKSIIGAIGEMDAYQLPDAKGYTSMLRYILGESDAYRQLIRDELMGTTIQDFHQFGNVLDKLNADGQVVVLGSEDALREANQQRGDWLKIEKVL
jgi:presequence protease